AAGRDDRLRLTDDGGAFFGGHVLGYLDVVRGPIVVGAGPRMARRSRAYWDGAADWSGAIETVSLDGAAALTAGTVSRPLLGAVVDVEPWLHAATRPAAAIVRIRSTRFMGLSFSSLVSRCPRGGVRRAGGGRDTLGAAAGQTRPTSSRPALQTPVRADSVSRA